MSRVSALLPPRMKREMKIGRARLFERLGSERFSMPALNGLDRKLLSMLPEIGVFVEIGANDGYSQSNTYYLERFRGWRGVLIEPLPSLYRTCSRLRNRSACVNVCCVSPNGPSSLQMVDSNLTSVAMGLQDSVEEERRLTQGSKRRSHIVTVPTMTMSNVLDSVLEPTIDFMSIDVEGTELEVLAGIDMVRHTPGYLMIETDCLENVVVRLKGFMHLERQLTFHDYLFIADDNPRGALC